jgi:hypothetical protein
MSTPSRLGEPLELPWWVVPLAIPPLLVTIGGLVLSAPLWAHLMVITSSVVVVALLLAIAVRVASSSMQSVWISVIYAFWVFLVVVWAVVVATTPSCHCA